MVRVLVVLRFGLMVRAGHILLEGAAAGLRCRRSRHRAVRGDAMTPRGGVRGELPVEHLERDRRGQYAGDALYNACIRPGEDIGRRVLAPPVGPRLAPMPHGVDLRMDRAKQAVAVAGK